MYALSEGTEQFLYHTKMATGQIRVLFLFFYRQIIKSSK
jgi:hypothetical protein